MKPEAQNQRFARELGDRAPLWQVTASEPGRAHLFPGIVPPIDEKLALGKQGESGVSQALVTSIPAEEVVVMGPLS